MLINPLNVLNIREVNTPPEGWEYIYLDEIYNIEDSLRKWININLSGRFFIAKTLNVNDNKSFEIKIKIGFEEPKEASYFLLACPLLKYSN
jgi:hypothetical protein